MASKFVVDTVISTRTRFLRLVPRNQFYNLQPLNQGRLITGQIVRRGRPPRAEATMNSFFNSDFFSDQVQRVLAPIRVFDILSINLFFGTSTYRVTPTNAWRQFLWGPTAVLRGRPTSNERVANTALRAMGAADPPKFLLSLLIVIAGMIIKLLIKQGRPPVTPLPVIDGQIIAEPLTPGAVQALEASLCFHVRCDHDRCDDQDYILKTEIADYVHYDQDSDRLIWACAKTRAYQPCIVTEAMPFVGEIEIFLG